MHKCTKGDDSMAKKRNIIVGQSGGPTSVINSSLAGVYKNAIERGFDKVYGMLHGIQGLLDGIRKRLICMKHQIILTTGR